MGELYQKNGPIWKISNVNALEGTTNEQSHQFNGREADKSETHQSKDIPRIKDIIGQAVHRIGTFHNLSTRNQVVALINDVRTS